MKRMITLSALMLFSLSLLPLAGCGGGNAEQAEKAKPGIEVAATHDCDGGCGMKDVPMDQLTEVDGKFYPNFAKIS